MHTCIHTYMHTYIHTYIHIHTYVSHRSSSGHTRDFAFAMLPSIVNMWRLSTWNELADRQQC